MPANPTSLGGFRGEYHTGPDEGALDDVVLGSDPIPLPVPAAGVVRTDR